MRAHPPSGTKIGINTSAPCIKFVFYCPKPGQGLKICLCLFSSDYHLFFQVTVCKELFFKTVYVNYDYGRFREVTAKIVIGSISH